MAGRNGARAQGIRRIVTANNSPYDTLDPHAVFDIGRIASRLNMYDCLVRWVDNPPQLVLWLAEKVDISPDGLTYTFTLRKGARFHDGTPITADDVVFSMERLLGMKKGAYGLFKGAIDPGKTAAIDPGTVRFTLNQPFAVFMSVLSELWIVNSRLVRANEASGDWGAAWLNRNEAGSGNFRLRRFDPAVGFQADRFDGHFMGWDQPHVDQTEFRVVLETTSRVLGMLKGDFNITDGYLPLDQIKRLRESDSIRIEEAESLRTMYFIIHNQRAPLNDVNMRKALSYAFDYDAFNNQILGGSVARNPGIIPNTMWGAPKDLKGYTYDLAKAKEHLAMVKAPLRPLSIGVLAGFGQSEQAALLLQNGLAKIGVEAKLVSEPWSVIQGKYNDPDRTHDLIPLWRSAYFADPHNWTGYIYNSRNIGSGNPSFYRNARVDELTDKALLLTDREQRQPMYEEVSRILVEEAAGLFIYNTKWYGPFTRNVRGVRFCPIGDAQDIRWMSLA
ncbi:ABC transporter substrate-binding protein [Limobrevibacterium gyesilva]|uniref:ABC transporter substrate-binding protein n=1 Tax=Limobrevibacterium gyesilva TaxID=2991712 RepID=A0AA42CG41_9PROT|nr:ABC transporter substrate-binding protein [Limobrevibacterium gyesilva]MCW3475621.1 ABC transporter substrate-binding protein [Limobrevibacterium gyesilva]